MTTKNPFERWYKCEICGELIREEWSQGVSTPFTTLINRLIHMLGHNFKEVVNDN